MRWNKSGLQFVEYPAQELSFVFFRKTISAWAEFFCMKKLWIILVIIAAVSGYVGYGWKPTAKEQVTRSEEQTVSTTVAVPTSTAQRVEPLDTVPVQTITSSLVVNNTTYSLAIPANSTAYDFMKLLREKTSFNFTGRDFGGPLGFFVEEINGVKNGQKFWIFSINGKKSQLGVSNYRIQSGDIISWNYEDKE